MRPAPPLIGALALLLHATVAQADVAAAPEPSCPPGTTPRSDHYGAYCQPPPPTSCPPGHLSRTTRDQAYCEPPPSVPCPRGSYWSSSSATDASCRAHRRCDQSPCSDAGECVDTAFCVVEERDSRRISERVTGSCEGDAVCSGEARCVRAARCTPRGASSPPRESPSPSGTPSPGASSEPGGVGGPAPSDSRGCSGYQLGAVGGGAVALALVAAFALVRRRAPARAKLKASRKRRAKRSRG
jgi:hypothetical protein